MNSLTRNGRPDVFQPQVDLRHARYIWLGTPLVFDAFKFFIAETDMGTVQAHAYPYSDSMSTFIVELAEDTWKRSGQVDSAERSWKPGESDAAGIELCASVSLSAISTTVRGTKPNGASDQMPAPRRHSRNAAIAAPAQCSRSGRSRRHPR